MKVYLTIFAGRKIYLEILQVYLTILLNKNIISEIHLWNYTKNNEDSEYLFELTKIDERYKLFVPKNKHGFQWINYYEYYKDCKYDDDDIIIKCDDDIVYIDIENIERFINNIKNDCIYFPNIVNNDVCAYIQTQNGIHNLLTNINKDKTEIGRKEPLTEWYKSHYLAEQVHKIFLENPKNFNIEQNEILWHSRLSINFFAGKYQIIKKYYTQYLEVKSDDEAFLSSSVCLKNNISNKILPYFVVVHFSFGPQNHVLLNNKFIDQYKNLSNLIKNHYNK